MAELSTTDRVFVAGLKVLSNRVALAALRRATRLLGIAVAHHLIEARSSGDPLQETMARLDEKTVVVSLLEQVVGLLGARWDKVPERRRPHYTPEQRFLILRLKTLLALSLDDTARLFRVSASSIARWEQQIREAPDTTAVGVKVHPVPPVRRYADVVTHLTQMMTAAGFGGCRRVASTLARAGFKLSRETVRRRHKENPSIPPAGNRTVRPRAPLIARFVHHIWLLDITSTKALFGGSPFKVAAFYDAYSRMPLAAIVCEKEPTAGDIETLAACAFRQHGRPRHVVTDRGSQFTSNLFRDVLGAFRVGLRFGAVGRTGSIALLERFWRSLKEKVAVVIARPLTLEDLEERLSYALLHYAFFRPHSAHGGATPAEIFFGLEPAHLRAVHPPRAPPGERPFSIPCDVAYLDPEHRFPVLIDAA